MRQHVTDPSRRETGHEGHRSIRFMPSMRSAYIERFEGGPDYTTYYANEEYLDPSLVNPTLYRRTSRKAFLRTIWRGDYDVLALPEPWWIVETPYTTLLAATARVRTLFRRRRPAIVTYAIDNAVPEVLLGLPGWMPVWLRRLGLSIFSLPYVLLLDRMAFGTEGAEKNYLGGLMLGLGRNLGKKSRTFLPLSPACDCPNVEKDPNAVLFLGLLEVRKGFDTLLKAWPGVLERLPSARLIVCGTGPLQADLDAAMSAMPSIEQVAGASRPRIHELLRESSVLVSFPRTLWRWREQIGLSLPEGISHGCHIVTTRQTGIADWLEEVGQSVIEPDAPIEAFIDAIVSAIEQPHPVPLADLPEVSGRASAEWWMAGKVDTNV